MQIDLDVSSEQIKLLLSEFGSVKEFCQKMIDKKTSGFMDNFEIFRHLMKTIEKMDEKIEKLERRDNG